MPNTLPIALDPWHHLRDVTPARIALGRAGGSLPTRALLEFQLAHALARDAVHQPFDPGRLVADLGAHGARVIQLASSAGDRQAYLLRPDLGRRLAPESRARLSREVATADGVDVSIVMSDGLSALAAHRQIPAVVGHVLPLLATGGFSVGPLVVIPLARVAIEDEVGEVMGARVSVILLGERPGLGSPDSLGAYLVYGPRVGRTDAERNCVSNIRPEGLAPVAAAELLYYLIGQAIRRQLSGVGLKDERASGALPI